MYYQLPILFLFIAFSQCSTLLTTAKVLTLKGRVIVKQVLMNMTYYSSDKPGCYDLKHIYYMNNLKRIQILFR